MSDLQVPAADPDVSSEGRSLSTVAYVLMIAVYLAIVQGVPYLTASGLDDVEYGTFPDVETVWLTLVVPVGASAVFAALVVTWLGWWPQVLRDHRPVQRWVWIIPIIMVVAILAGTDYASLVDQSVGFVALLLFGALLVGLTEETMFRGIGVTAFRTNGFPESRVALWTCLVFGLAHGTNIFVEGAGAIMQVLVTILAGFFFYLALRVSGSLLVPILIHAFWDFGLLTGAITDDAYAASSLFLLANLVMGIILLVRRHKIEPTDSTVAVAS